MATQRAALDLEGGVAAPRRARRFVSQQLAEWQCAELAEVASLCVSEIVTNAVFHAGRGIGIRMQWAAPTLRVEVSDASPDSAIPTAVVAAVAEEHLWGSESSVAHATSGRGLFVVASVAKVLGERRADDGPGKVVWFELDRDSVMGHTAPALGTIVQQLPDEPGRGPGIAVVLNDVPVDDAIASDSHMDALLRELQLLAGADRELAALVDGLRAARGVLPFFATVREQLLIQSLRSIDNTDIAIEVTKEQADAVRELPRVLDRLERLDEQGVLLTLPASPEVRRWLSD
jgi:anti-sigma regulatory factor (Ser/Thr protein kinase)